MDERQLKRKIAVRWQFQNRTRFSYTWDIILVNTQWTNSTFTCLLQFCSPYKQDDWDAVWGGIRHVGYDGHLQSLIVTEFCYFYLGVNLDIWPCFNVQKTQRPTCTFLFSVHIECGRAVSMLFWLPSCIRPELQTPTDCETAKNLLVCLILCRGVLPCVYAGKFKCVTRWRQTIKD